MELHVRGCSSSPRCIAHRAQCLVTHVAHYICDQEAELNAFIFPNMTFSNWFHDFPFQVISEINLNILYSQPHSFSSALVFLIII